MHRCRSIEPRTRDDNELREGWMKDRTNPITGEPLEIWAGALPPGSMVSILCHTAHGVSPRVLRGDAERDGYLHTDSTRWAALFSYRQPDPTRQALPVSRGVPEPFRLAARRGEVPALRGKPELLELFPGEALSSLPARGGSEDGSVRVARALEG